MHRFGIWSAAFRYFGLLGSERTCVDCGMVERACLGGYRSYPDNERRNRAAAYLTARLAR